MDDLDLVAKYVKEMKCSHCKGTGKCSCFSCKIGWSGDFMNPVNGIPHYIDRMQAEAIGNPALDEKLRKMGSLFEKEKKGVCHSCRGKGHCESVDFEQIRKDFPSTSMQTAVQMKLHQLVPHVFG